MSSTIPHEGRAGFRAKLGLPLLAAFCVGLFYAAFLEPDVSGDYRYPQHRYYAMQAQAWLDGRLDLGIPVPPGFAALPDPFDPEANEKYRFGGQQGFHDLSFYQGKFYLYWGPGPALTAFLPWRILTGKELPGSWAGWAFAMGAWGASALFLLRLVARQPGRVPPIAMFGGLVALAICSWAIVLLRRAAIWELAILAATCFGAGFWWTLAESVWADSLRARTRWLVAASVLLGLAVASRPIWIVCSPVLLWPLWRYRSEWRRTPFWQLAAAAVLPVTFAAVGLLLLNRARFDHWLDFGQQWQVAGVRVKGAATFGLAQFGYNLRQYLFSLPVLIDYFPFVADPYRATPPAGYLGLENTFGLLVTLPALWLGAALVLQRSLAIALAPVAVSGVALLGVLSLFNGAAGRYQFELAAPLALLAAGGIISLGLRSSPPGWLRGGIVAASLLVSLFAVASVSWRSTISISGRFDIMPRAERIANAVATAVGWCPADGLAAVEFNVLFPPPGEKADMGALIASGRSPFFSSIGFEYPTPDTVRAVAFCGYSIIGSKDVPLDRTIPHRIRVELGAMLPPDRHPFWNGVPPDEVRKRRMHVAVSIDGQLAMAGTMQDFPPDEDEPQLNGFRDATGATVNRFKGKILETRLIRIAPPGRPGGNVP